MTGLLPQLQGVLGELCQRVPRLFALLALGRGDGGYAMLMRQIGHVDLLILDDSGPEPLLPEQQRDLVEIVEDPWRPADGYGRRPRRVATA